MEHEKNVFGNYDTFVKIIERTLNVTIIERNGEIKVMGNEEDVSKAIMRIHATCRAVQKRQYHYRTASKLCIIPIIR